jgi:hypothetical protein
MKLRGNSYLIHFLIITFFLFTYSCIETSDFDVFEKGEKKVVIEGKITDIDSVCTVIVSRSVDPNDTARYKPLDNATVYLKDDQGNTATLVSVGSGKYRTSEIKGIPGHQYLLVVDVDSIRYRSLETMPPKPKIDSVGVKYQKDYTIFDSIGYYVTFYSGKNDDKVQYYRVEVESNGVPFDDYSDLLLYEDSHIDTFYRMRLPYLFNVGDSISVKIYSLSAPVYEYFSGLSKQFTTNFSNIQPPLMNPESNISPDPLGYFQASSVASASVVISDLSYEGRK